MCESVCCGRSEGERCDGEVRRGEVRRREELRRGELRRKSHEILFFMKGRIVEQ